MRKSPRVLNFISVQWLIFCDPYNWVCQIYIIASSSVPQSSVSITKSSIRFVSGLETVLSCTATVANGVPSSLVNVNWSGGVSLSNSSRVTVSDVTNNGLQYTTVITFSPLLSRDGGQYNCSMSVNGFDEADNSDSLMIMVNGKWICLEKR